MLGMRTGRQWVGLPGVVLGLAACSGASGGQGAPVAAEPVLVTEPARVGADEGAGRPSQPLFEAIGSCQRQRPGVGTRRLGPVRSSSSVALAVATEAGKLRTVAYVADGDEALLHTVDLDRGREVATTALRGPGEQVLVLADGRVAVTLRQTGEVQVLEPAASVDQALEARCAIGVPTEPIALAESPDGAMLALTSGWARALTVFDSGSLAARWQVKLPREPRSVVVSDDGQRVFVAHVVNAVLSVVDLKGDQHEPRSLDLRMKSAGQTSSSRRSNDASRMRSGCQGFALVASVEMPHREAEVAPPLVAGERPPAVMRPPALVTPAPTPAMRPAGRLFAPFVTVDPGEPTRVSAGYGNSRANSLPAELSAVSVIDAGAERLFTRAVGGLVRGGQPAAPGVGAARDSATQADCLLPRAAAYADGALLVACQGNDALVEYDARSIDPARAERRRWRLPAGPDGVAVDSLQGRAVVHARFDHLLAVVTLGASAAPREIALTRPTRPTLTTAQETGRKIFHTAHDPRISADGRACASCHPDGREDALTWSTPDGPRQTLLLTGRLPESGPYGWSGASASVEQHLQQTFERLGGHGLPEDARQALVGYISTLGAPRPGRPTTWVQRQGSRVERGRTLFTSGETACSSCHPGGLSDGQNHAVTVKARAGQNDRLDTPSLRCLSQSAPYFHDGRYTTLAPMQGRACGWLEATDHHMGQSLQLSLDDRRALLAYLETL